MENLNFALLTQDELFTLVQRILVHSTEANSETLNLTKVNDVIGGIQETFLESMTKDNRRSDYTEILSAKNDLRKNGFLSFRYKIKSCIYSNSPEVAAAARNLMQVIRKHGYSMQNLAYKTESTKMTELVSELEQEPASTWVTTTTTGPELTLLKSANADFEEMSIEKAETESAENVPAATEVRKQLEKQFRMALNMLEGNYNFDGGEELKILLDAIYEEIDAAMIIARARATRNKNNDDKEDTVE